MNNTNNAIMTKAKSMFGNRLKAENYQLLLQKNNIPEVSAYLKNETYFHSSLNGINDKAVHRGQLELLIKSNLFDRFSRLMRYASNDSSDFYRFAIIESEIIQLLAIVRSFMANDSTSYIAAMPTYMEDHMCFDLTKLGKANDFSALLEALKDTKYYDILSRFAKEKIQDLNYVALESELYSYYYHEVLRLSKKNFSGQVLKNVEDIIYTEIELNNISKIYRLKKYFKSSPTEIRKYMVNVNRFFSKKELDDMIENLDSEGVINKLLESRYKAYIKDEKFEKIEYFIQKINYEINKKLIYFSNNSNVVLLSYMNLSLIEVENIIDIIEAARYGIPSEKTSKLLIY